MSLLLVKLFRTDLIQMQQLRDYMDGDGNA